MSKEDKIIGIICGSISLLLLLGIAFFFQYKMLELSVKHNSTFLQLLSVMIPVCFSKMWFEGLEEAMKDIKKGGN